LNDQIKNTEAKIERNISKSQLYDGKIKIIQSDLNNVFTNNKYEYVLQRDQEYDNYSKYYCYLEKIKNELISKIKIIENRNATEKLSGTNNFKKLKNEIKNLENKIINNK